MEEVSVVGNLLQYASVFISNLLSAVATVAVSVVLYGLIRGLGTALELAPTGPLLAVFVIFALSFLGVEIPVVDSVFNFMVSLF